MLLPDGTILTNKLEDKKRIIHDLLALLGLAPAALDEGKISMEDLQSMNETVVSLVLVTL